jgi:ABC-type multidrug transport system ATPase subunit
VLAVELTEVTKTFGPVRALVQVSAKLAGGQVSAILGPNGSGKSTLLAILGTLMRPTSGKVDHGELGPGRDAVRGALGWVGHESLCYPELTGRENVELAARLHGRDPERAVEEATARFDLGPFLGRPVRTYSRGQRQRIALARALVHRPRLLLLDEPTTGLDAASTKKLSEVIRAEARVGAVVVVVTHDAAFADVVADVKIELDRGRRV